MIVYKLTDEDGYTRRGLSGETLWAPGVTKKAFGKDELCTSQWLHAYEHPLLAVLHDPIHGKYGDTARMWECDTMDGVIKKDGQMKLGTTVLKIVKEIQKPKVTLEQRVAYAISCSLRVYAGESYVKWAEDWLSGKERSERWAGTELTVAVVAWSAVVYATEAAMTLASAYETPSVPQCIEFALRQVGMYVANAAADASRGTEDLDLVDCAREVFLV